MLRQMGPQMRCYAAAAGGALPQTSSPPGLADEPELPIADSSGKLHYPQQQNPPREPWTPTRELAKRNFLPRRMGHLIQVQPIPPSHCLSDACAGPDSTTHDQLGPAMPALDTTGSLSRASDSLRLQGCLT